VAYSYPIGYPGSNKKHIQDFSVYRYWMQENERQLMRYNYGTNMDFKEKVCDSWFSFVSHNDAESVGSCIPDSTHFLSSATDNRSKEN